MVFSASDPCTGLALTVEFQRVDQACPVDNVDLNIAVKSCMVFDELGRSRAADSKPDG